MQDAQKSQPELLKEIISWLEANQTALIQTYEEALTNMPANFFACLETSELKNFAATNIKGITTRMKGVQMSMERTEQNLFGFFERGATLADLNQVLDTCNTQLIAYIRTRHDLSNQAKTLLEEKFAYIKTAYSTITSLTMLKYQNSKKS